ncbi:MAG: TonB-dependent receptor plug domain-containing protein, partial [Candidatus Eisenbacteria bacterium]|nr:TonB-dependent receptor plug domain-containing protein [Candidatus Eisenbacteria bacterium]
MELRVAPGAHLAVSLEPAASELDELSVKAPYLEGALSSSVAERRTEKRVVEVLGAEEMGRAGDGDAAAALTRATGLTLVGGKYVYVRGLGERYSSTLLDGATLPSPEPERRVVPLDLFPTGVLSSVVVQKTWSPELPADFGGGTIALRTRRIPEEAFLQTSVSLGGVYGSTLSEAP